MGIRDEYHRYTYEIMKMTETVEIVPNTPAVRLRISPVVTRVRGLMGAVRLRAKRQG